MSDSKARILVVDDNLHNLKLLKDVLMAHDYQVHFATNGTDALLSVQAEPPDLILLDVKMPDIDGYEVCQRLKSNPSHQDIPVIFITVRDKLSDKMKAFSIGGVDYLTKPFEAEEVIARVKTHLTINTLKRQLEKANETLEEKVRSRTEELRQSEERFRTLIELSPTGVFLTDAEGQCTYWNPRIAKFTGISTEEAQGDGWVLGIHEEDRERSFAEWTRCCRERIPYNIESRYVDREGRSTWVIAQAVELTDSKDRITGYMGTSTDITDRKLAEGALKKSQRLLAESQSVGKVGGWEISTDTQELTWTEQTYAILEVDLTYEPTVEKVINFYTTASIPIIKQAMQRAIDHGEPYDVELEIITAKGNTRSIHVIGKADIEHHRVYGFFQDITTQKESEKAMLELERQLQQSQKMEAVGTLAGGIAHDFNNILAIILGNAELASDDIPDLNPAAENLEEIRRASIRAKDMVRQLLSFSRKSDQKRAPLNLVPIINESMKMLRTAIPSSVEFSVQIPDEPCNIMGDAVQINQIMMNLTTNAAHAMAKEGGLLEVTLENIVLLEEKPCFNGVLSLGAYARLKMRDTGKGMAPETMARIFEPYYTTKDVGKGTGMGLSVIHGIMKGHLGGIRVESELGKGTHFEVYFPALEKMIEEEKEPHGEIKGGSESILFVDDEESMVNLNRQRLERLGYQVKSTTRPLQALEWFSADPDQFDVIITDMTMPRMTGDRLTKEILTIRPQMPVIICTGYSERISAEEAEALGARKYIEKPIDVQNLAAALREVLDEN